MSGAAFAFMISFRCMQIIIGLKFFLPKVSEAKHTRFRLFYACLAKESEHPNRNISQALKSPQFGFQMGVLSDAAV